MIMKDNDLYAQCLMPVQRASEPGTSYDAVPDDNVGLHLEFGRHHVVYLKSCYDIEDSSANSGQKCKQDVDVEGVTAASSPTTYICIWQYSH